MEAEAIIAITGASSAVVIACIAAVIAVFSCKYSRKKKSQTAKEATQVELVHEQHEFKIGFIQYNSKKDNTYIKDGSLRAFNESSTSWETQNSETANALANGGVGEVLDFASRGLETGARVYTEHRERKINNVADSNEEENIEYVETEYSEIEIEEHEIPGTYSPPTSNPSTPRAATPTPRAATSTPRPAATPLAEFLALQTPENAGKGSEKYIAMFAQPPASQSATPRSKVLNPKEKKLVEPAANKFWSFTSKNKKKVEEEKKEEVKKEAPDLELSQASSSDLNQKNKVSSSQDETSTNSQHNPERHQPATRKESSLKNEIKEPSRVSSVKFNETPIIIDDHQLNDSGRDIFSDSVKNEVSLSGGNTTENIEENV